MRKYFIWTPVYQKSNGVRVLHYLSRMLIEHGFDSKLVSNAKSSPDYVYAEEITDEMRENDIVVYPEVVKGNPLGFKRVVRWVLYYPGVLGGTKSYDDREIIFTWKKSYYNTENILTLSCIDTKIFYNDNSPKSFDAYFVHKGGKCRTLENENNMIRIDMDYPESREELGNILRKTDTFYTFDNNTLMIEEAIMCGAKVKYVAENEITDLKSNFKVPSEEEVERMLGNFIAKTQDESLSSCYNSLETFLDMFSFKLLIKSKLLYARIFNKQKALNKYKGLDKFANWGLSFLKRSLVNTSK